MTILSNAALDAIFEPRGSSTKRDDVELEISGVDISNRYYSIDEGGTIPGTNTNLESGGTDIRQLFAAVGTLIANAALPADFSVVANTSSPTDAIATVTLATDGDVTSRLNTDSAIDRGDWVDNKTGLDGSKWEARGVYFDGDNELNGPSGYNPLSSPQSWNVTRTQNFGGWELRLDITVREIADTSNTDTIRVTLDASVE